MAFFRVSSGGTDSIMGIDVPDGYMVNIAHSNATAPLPTSGMYAGNGAVFVCNVDSWNICDRNTSYYNNPKGYKADGTVVNFGAEASLNISQCSWLVVIISGDGVYISFRK